MRVLRVAWVQMRSAEAAPLSSTGPEVAEVPPAASARRGRGARRQERRLPTGLRVVEPADGAGRTFTLTSETVIGRSADCAISITGDTFVSSAHARVFASDGRVLVEDLGSTNGTFLNSNRISEPTPLFRGDRLQIGRTVLEATA
jgi:pSer/pThr/pTyr-binding forkhead associated (FHA) protein